MSQESGVRSQESGVRSQESGVRSQESGVRSQESGVRSQGRIVGLDFVKGVAIFLVVFGHCIQYGNGKGFDFWSNPAFKIIYSFHMPLFALVSGYLFFWSVSSRTPREVIIKQIKTFILPSLSWALLTRTIIEIFHVYQGNFDGIYLMLFHMLRSFLYGLWFLWAMFLASMIVMLAREKFNDSIKFYLFALLLLLFVPSKLAPSTNVFVYPYFVAGYIWHRDGMGEKFRLNMAAKVGVILLWCIMLAFFDKDSYVYTTGTALVKYHAGEFVPSQLWTDIFRWITGFAGCAAVLVMLGMMKPVKFIAAIGTKSLGIYAINGQVMSWLPAHGGYITNFVEAVIITAVCYALSVMISRVKFLNRLLFGGR